VNRFFPGFLRHLPVAAGITSACGLVAALVHGPVHAEAPTSPAARRPNLVVVSMDTCRADHYSYAGYTRNTTPNVDRLARKGTVFNNAASQANETLYSHASLFTSRYPGDIAPIAGGFYLPDTFYTLAEVLKLYGYATGAFTGGAHVKSAFGLSQGFDVYLDDLDFASIHHSFAAASLWMEEHKSDPFFLFLHGYDCHSPYHKPLFFDGLFAPPNNDFVEHVTRNIMGIERIYRGQFFRNAEITQEVDVDNRKNLSEDFFRTTLPQAEYEGLGGRRLTAEDAADFIAHYDGGLAYADLYIGLLMDRLRTLGVQENTAVVVLADHGENLTDAPWWHHRAALTEGDVHVPLVVYTPFLPASAGRKVDGQVELVDVLPTVLDLAGVPPPAEIAGQSLRPWLEGEKGPERPVAFTMSRSQASVRTADGLLVLNRRPVWTPPDAPAVPEWQWQGFTSQELPAELDVLMQDALVKWLSQRQPAVRASLAPVDPVLERALRDRGYW